MNYAKNFIILILVLILSLTGLTATPANGVENNSKYDKNYFLTPEQEEQVERFNNFYYLLSIFNDTKTYETLNKIISYHIYAGNETITHVVSAGDSLSTGFDSTEDCFLKDCTFNTWSIGSHKESILNQINELNKAEALPLNIAQTGATASMLQKQLNRIPEEGIHSVNITIGSNDACTPKMTDSYVFQKHITDALKEYSNRKPNSIIYMFSIPDIVGLYDAFKDNPAAQLTWDLTGFCKNVFSSDATNNNRMQVDEKIKQLNSILAEVCTQKFSKICRWDNYSLYKHKFSKNEISTIDYFHPSLEGQKKLSQIAWKQGYTLF